MEEREGQVVGEEEGRKGRLVEWGYDWVESKAEAELMSPVKSSGVDVETGTSWWSETATDRM